MINATEDCDNRLKSFGDPPVKVWVPAVTRRTASSEQVRSLWSPPTENEFLTLDLKSLIIYLELRKEHDFKSQTLARQARMD